MRRFVMLAVPLVLTAAMAAPASATASVGDVVTGCSGNRPYGNTGAWYGDLSVRNMSCRRAHRSLRTARFTRTGQARVFGFSCYRAGTYGDGGIFRCTRHGTAMRFSAGG